MCQPGTGFRIASQTIGMGGFFPRVRKSGGFFRAEPQRHPILPSPRGRCSPEVVENGGVGAVAVARGAWRPSHLIITGSALVNHSN